MLHRAERNPVGKRTRMDGVLPMDNVLRIVNRANQRGGRMLSVVDLVEAGTLSLDQASWLCRRILEGSSFLTGATPGGAGKTTVMGALLTMLPPDTGIHLTAGSGWRSVPPGDCVVSYELNDAFYEAYIWGGEVAQLARLGTQGRRIVANLHADTVGQARRQIVDQCGATEQGFAAFSLFIPIRMERGASRGLNGRYGGIRRTVDVIYEARDGEWREAAIEPDREITAFLQSLRTEEIREIEPVRRRWLEAIRAGWISA